MNKDALDALSKNIKRPLDHLYNKLESEGLFDLKYNKELCSFVLCQYS